MKKALLTRPHTIETRDSAIPTINPNQVLLKVISVGVCGSDIQMYNGKHKYMTYPVVPGHEVAAVIEEVGTDVVDFKVGDRVTVEPQIYCGKCYPCLIGRFNVCEQLKVKGVHTDGFASEYVAIEPGYLHFCPNNLDFDNITLVEPLAVAIGSIKRAKYRSANIVVIGAGTIGNLIAQSAQALGANKVLITDIMDNKLAFARQCGIEYCINTGETELKQAIEKVFGERKADVIIDTAATNTSFASALEASRPSSEIIITGNYKNPVKIEVPRIQRREVSLIGHMMYVREDYVDAIALLAERKIKTDGFITRRFNLDEFNKAFNYIELHLNDTMKVIIDIGSC